MDQSMTPMAEEVCNNNNNDIVKLQSCDGKIFEVETEVASSSGIIKRMMGNLGTNITIPLPLVSAKILRRVIQYCRYHVLDAPTVSLDAVKTWDEEFVKALVEDRAILFEVTKAAHYLVVTNLLDLMCQTIADMLKGKTAEQMRTLVGHILAECPLSYVMEMYPTKISKEIFIAAFTSRNNQSFLSSSHPKTFPSLMENGVVVLDMRVDSELPTTASLVLDHVNSYLYNEIPAEAVEATANVKEGNKELTKAIERNSSSRAFLLLFLVVLPLTLLFLDWYQ